jgi:hypothetical protein
VVEKLPELGRGLIALAQEQTRLTSHEHGIASEFCHLKKRSRKASDYFVSIRASALLISWSKILDLQLMRHARAVGEDLQIVHHRFARDKS